MVHKQIPVEAACGNYEYFMTSVIKYIFHLRQSEWYISHPRAAIDSSAAAVDSSAAAVDLSM